MKEDINYSWILFSILLVIGLHFKVATFSNFQVAFSFLLIPFWAIFSFRISPRKIPTKAWIYLTFISILPFIPGNILDWEEFFKTYFQYIISYSIVIFVLFNKTKINQISVISFLKYTQLVLFLSTLIQYIFVIQLGDTNFYNIFGANQLYFQLEFSLSAGRMKSFYLEPSYLAFVTTNIFWCRLYFNELFNENSLNSFSNSLISSNFLYTIIILWLTNSSTGYIYTSLIIFYHIFSKLNLKKSLNFGIVIFICLTYIFYNYSEEIYKFLRIDEITGDADKTLSGFARITLPIQILKKVWNEGYYFGLTFGQLDKFSFKMTSAYEERGISNSFFLILGYFGVIGLLVYGYFLKLFISVKKKTSKSLILLTFLNLTNSGAFVTTQFIFMAFLLPFLVINIDNKNEQKKPF